MLEYWLMNNFVKTNSIYFHEIHQISLKTKIFLSSKIQIIFLCVNVDSLKYKVNITNYR